jgi:hypothetical protein
MASSANPWRLWCKDNHVGQNYGWRAIAEGKLKVRRIGKRMLVLAASPPRVASTRSNAPRSSSVSVSPK